MGSDSVSRIGVYELLWFQSTLPHGERPGANIGTPRLCPVSIHAPAWGATDNWRIGNATRSFNPRSRMGSDVANYGLKVSADGVSIHAPAWGATSHPISGSSLRNVSIHAPAWGATKSICHILYHPRFQSTLPHGERQCHRIYALAINMFQSTLPHGERLGAY